MAGDALRRTVQVDAVQSPTAPRPSDRFGNAVPCGYAALEWSGSTWRIQGGLSNLPRITSAAATQHLSKRPLSQPQIAVIPCVLIVPQDTTRLVNGGAPASVPHPPTRRRSDLAAHDEKPRPVSPAGPYSRPAPVPARLSAARTHKGEGLAVLVLEK